MLYKHTHHTPHTHSHTTCTHHTHTTHTTHTSHTPHITHTHTHTHLALIWALSSVPSALEGEPHQWPPQPGAWLETWLGSQPLLLASMNVNKAAVTKDTQKCFKMNFCTLYSACNNETNITKSLKLLIRDKIEYAKLFTIFNHDH